ncbi:hypothetical protein VNO77_18228 [Canavalia gladiata]|uniref:Uncharacterized protein n=1 Tax=Canavalia gladiata TaxID=3824 RepID=A0AAN9LNS4_CANGL
MGGKYSLNLLFVFKLFKSKKGKGRGYDGNEGGRKVWPSDEDRGTWGVAEPNIDKKAGIFIAHHKKRVYDHQL